jgi:hypothetical protein
MLNFCFSVPVRGESLLFQNLLFIPSKGKVACSIYPKGLVTMLDPQYVLTEH